MSDPERRVLRVQGRFLERLADLAAERVGRSAPDTAAADAVSRARLKRRGGGWTAYVELTAGEALTVADWLEPSADTPARHVREILRRFEVTA